MLLSSVLSHLFVLLSSVLSHLFVRIFALKGNTVIGLPSCRSRRMVSAYSGLNSSGCSLMYASVRSSATPPMTK